MAMAVPAHAGPWTEEDLVALPDDGQRYELLEGSLLVSPPPAVRHQRVTMRVVRLINDATPEGFEAVEAIGVRLPGGSLFVPDVVVAGVDSFQAAESGVLDASEVHLIVEVVSPGSATTDRLTKPALYAGAGIPAFWRIELEEGPAVYVYRLEQMTYVDVSSARPGDRLVLDSPFRISFDPRDLSP
jgi:Uma2 family endonuclease